MAVDTMIGDGDHDHAKPNAEVPSRCHVTRHYNYRTKLMHVAGSAYCVFWFPSAQF